MIVRSPSRAWREPLTVPLSVSLAVLLLLSLSWLGGLAEAKKDEPSVQKHKFKDLHDRDSPPRYFEDSDTILILDDLGNVLLSKDLGGDDFEFAPVADVPPKSAWSIHLHPFDNQVAYVWGRDERTHWVTEDQGQSWRKFEIEGIPGGYQTLFRFHARDPKKVLVNVCKSLVGCNAVSYYTLDAFKTPAKEMRKNTRSCLFARSTELFQTSEDDKDDNRVICVVQDSYTSPFSRSENRLSVSDNYFKDETEPVLDEGRMVRGILNVAEVKGFLVAAASARGTSELAMYVTDDASVWHRAVFPKDHRLEEDAYTVLESTNYSIQVDVMTTMPVNAMGVLFTSNSNGTYFTRNIEHTNRAMQGYVDFEKVSGIQGIVLVNVVDNWKDVERFPLTLKKQKSKISFDDGRTFHAITADDKEIHLHSVSDIANMGKVFSSPAPGVVMGIGNQGEHLGQYKEGDLYVSDNAGVTWSKALKKSHKYEFGDRGSVLLAIYDEEDTDVLSYSINHGKDWREFKLDQSVRARILTTTPDSTSLKFLLLATAKGETDYDYYAYSINFEGLHEGKCKDSDFEKWYARVDDKGEPTCIMGHKQWYRRRKADADCFVDREFEDPKPEFEPCACTPEDFECDYDFVRSEDGEKCVVAPGTTLDVSEGQCKDAEGTYKGTSGFRQIPGNDCDRKAKGSVLLDTEEERPCKETSKTPATGDITNENTPFPANEVEQWFYMERSDRSLDTDEVVIMRTDQSEIFFSKDAGKTWDPIFKGEKITAIYPNRYNNDIAYFLTNGKKVHYTVNRGKSFSSFDAPASPTTNPLLPALNFHPKYKDWLIWTGAVDCDKSKGDCHNVAFFTEDRGASWEHQLRYVNKCEFIDQEGGSGLDKLVYCEQHKDEVLKGQLQLKYSENWFAEEKKPFDDIIDFATMAEFIVVAARREDDHDALTCHTSVDGKTFADAEFPPSFKVPTQKAYTVLDSATHAVFLHVTVNNQKGYEYGSIIKSNSNGTSYVMSLEGVNRDERGYVDFEKTLGLEGVIMVNIVGNTKEADAGKTKKIKTVITHNDGSQWAPLRAPEKDADGKQTGCDISKPEKCSLHLHSYTERRDTRATYSSPTAIGLMIGTGNVGEFLTGKAEADTFMTRDGGIEWYPVRKGCYLWEYGDQGSIIVIVKDNEPTKEVHYSLDEGKTWKDYQFADVDFVVESLSTVPSDKSRNFILWGKEVGASRVSTVNLDFSGLTDRKCELNENHPEDGDYYLWEPRHPMQKDNCLLGHVAQYHRKRIESVCYNGPDIPRHHSIARNCSCIREDFECDYNYQLATDGSCRLVPGLSPPDHSQACRDNPKLESFYLPTGYRKTPLDTCEGGSELEFIPSKEFYCPDYEDEFKRTRQGLHGFAFFLVAVLLPFALAGGVGYWFWRNWDGKFGQIRLGETATFRPSSSAFDASRPWIKYPVVAVSAIVAVAAAAPLLLTAAWRFVATRMGWSTSYSYSGLGGSSSGANGGLGSAGGRRSTVDGTTGGRRYTSRSDFARGAGRYAVVDPDEDEELFLDGGAEDDEGATVLDADAEGV